MPTKGEKEMKTRIVTITLALVSALTVQLGVACAAGSEWKDATTTASNKKHNKKHNQKESSHVTSKE